MAATMVEHDRGENALNHLDIKTYRENTPDRNWNDWLWQKRNAVSIYPNDRGKNEKVGKLVAWLGDPNIEQQKLASLTDIWAINLTPHLALQLSRLRESGHTEWYQQMLHWILPTDERRNTLAPKEFREGTGTTYRREEAYPDLPWSISRLYDNRVVVRTSSMCAVACQFCFRQHDVAEHHAEEGRVRSGVNEAVDYVKQWNQLNPTKPINDVILSGGDPLSRSDKSIIEDISAFKEIDGVELLRIDTKYPAVLPQRITPELANALKQFKPLRMNLHFTHPGEISPEAEQACDLLADAGIVLGSHTPLLKGVNDDRETLKQLFWKLTLMRVQPYYLIQSIDTPGTDHFRVPVERGRDFQTHLEADLSGVAHPHYIVYTTDGGGKVHLSPDPVVKRTKDGWYFDTHSGTSYYPDPKV